MGLPRIENVPIIAGAPSEISPTKLNMRLPFLS
jgi:hypothetical protein